MKYKGTAIGGHSKNGSIYQILAEEKNCYIWRASISAVVEKERIHLSFYWDKYNYKVLLNCLKENYYQGNIFRDGDDTGRAYFWLYAYGNKLMLHGDWEEDDWPDACFIKLDPIE